MATTTESGRVPGAKPGVAEFAATGAWPLPRAAKETSSIAYYLAEIDANRGVDIDDEEDLRLAELLVQGLIARDGAFSAGADEEELL